MRRPTRYILAVIIAVMSLAGCITATPTPAANPPISTNTAIPASNTPISSPTITPIQLTSTRLPTRARVTPSPTPSPQRVVTYTSTPGPSPTAPKNAVVNTGTNTPNPTAPKGTPATSTPTDTPAAEGPTDTPTPLTDLGVVVSQSLPDKSTVSPGQVFQVTWTLMNTGSTTWTTSYFLKWYGGLRSANMAPPNTVLLSSLVPPGGSIPITVTIQAPSTAGPAFTLWYLQDPATGLAFARAYLLVVVLGPTATP